MLALGELILFFASAAGCARFYSLVVATRSTLYVLVLLRLRISCASQQRSYITSFSVMLSMPKWLVSSGVSVIRDLGHQCSALLPRLACGKGKVAAYG